MTHTVDMTIDEGALAHIMSVLTNLYSDPELAVIREYSTNARDAHITAMVQRPIEVTLPSGNNEHQLVIRDYGLGLDALDIAEIYSRYGASSKRGTDEVVGQLGLGCKSALAYTDRFSLIGIKDGIRTQVEVSRDELKGGQMTVVNEDPSTLLEGVEVRIPIKYSPYFEEKVRDFFKFWDKGTVLINGVEPKKVDGFWVADDLCLTSEVDDDTIVMGGVPYTIPTGYLAYYTVAFVDIGAVDFSPSRESLIMSTKTKAVIENLRARVKAERDAAIEAQINEQPTKHAALHFSLTMNGYGYQSEAHYKGEKIPISTPVGSYVHVRGQKRRGKNFSHESKIFASVFEPATWFTGYNKFTFTPLKTAKLEQWQAAQGTPTPTSYIFVDQMPDELKDWIDPKKVHPWQEVHEQKLPKEAKEKKRQDGRPTGSYLGYVNGENKSSLMAEDIDTEYPILYSPHVHYTYAVDFVRDRYQEVDQKVTIVCLSPNRIKKFLRDFPQAVTVESRVVPLTKAWLDRLTAEEKQHIAFHNVPTYDHGKLKRLDPTKVHDPDLIAAIYQINQPRDDKLWGKFITYKQHISDLLSHFPIWDNPLDRYPLMTHISVYSSIDGELAEHVYMYLNTAYDSNMLTTIESEDE